MTNKTIYLITGSIASGKSTIAYNFVKKYNLTNLPYVSTDVFHRVIFDNNLDFEYSYNLARKYTDKILEFYIESGKSFIWETVLSKEKKKVFIEKCKSLGYNIVCLFIGAPLLVTKERALRRIDEGDHFVETSFIEDRYFKSLNALAWLPQFTNVLLIIDNSKIPKLLFFKNDKTKYLIDRLPAWANGLKNQ